MWRAAVHVVNDPDTQDLQRLARFDDGQSVRSLPVPISINVEANRAASLQRAVARQPAAALLGPRQVGKTSLARQLAQSSGGLYRNLENFRDREKLTDPRLRVAVAQPLVATSNHQGTVRIVRLVETAGDKLSGDPRAAQGQFSKWCESTVSTTGRGWGEYRIVTVSSSKERIFSGEIGRSSFPRLALFFEKKSSESKRSQKSWALKSA